jgi:hypothetical protein
VKRRGREEWLVRPLWRGPFVTVVAPAIALSVWISIDSRWWVGFIVAPLLTGAFLMRRRIIWGFRHASKELAENKPDLF